MANAVQEVITLQTIGTEFEVAGAGAAGAQLKLKVDTTITQNGAGELGVDITALDIVSADGGNLLTVGGDGGAFFNQAALQAAETVWSGASTGFLTVTPAGTNGHAPTFALDFTDPVFIEGVQDAVGQALLNGAGITYDDVANSISSALGSVTWGNGLTATGLTNVAVLADPNSPSAVTVTAAGISVTPGISTDAGNLATLGSDNKVMVDPAAIDALATITLCSVDGTPLMKGFAA